MKVDSRADALAELLLHRQVEAFLAREAELADAHRYDDWFALWDDTLTYWVPCAGEAGATPDPSRDVSIVYDDRPRLEERIFRLKTKFAHSQNPRSRLVRAVSNVVIGPFDPAAGGSVQSNVLIGEVRHDRQQVWVGRQRHELVGQAGAWRIRSKRVDLINGDAALPNLTFLI